jgi:anti-sigma factor RsiW
MTCSTEVDLGAYVLDALEPDEAEEVRQHLHGCPECQDELNGLSDTVIWLALLTPEEVEHLDEPRRPADVPRPRSRRVLALAVAGGIAASVFAGFVRTAEEPPDPPSGAVVRAVDPASHVQAAVTISARQSETRLGLSLKGAYPRGWCSLVAHSSDGRSETAASWLADPDGSADVTGTTAITRDRLSELDVVTDTGRLLVRIPVAPATADHSPIPIRRTL